MSRGPSSEPNPDSHGIVKRADCHELGGRVEVGNLVAAVHRNEWPLLSSQDGEPPTHR
jgi:hypothetical protein